MYYRKKKLARQTPGSFSQSAATTGSNGLLRQAVEKSRKHEISEDVPDSARLENTVVNAETYAVQNRLSDGHNVVNVLGDCFSLDDVSCKELENVAREVKGT